VVGWIAIVRVAVSGGAGSPSSLTATVERGGSIRVGLGCGAAAGGSVGTLRTVGYGDGAGRIDAVVGGGGAAGDGVGGTGRALAAAVAVEGRSDGLADPDGSAAG